ncbi:MAG: ferredoxin thioredoxin reductase catalytic beta chain [Lachnospiraceae bacterium]|nr:ferredoxin thioredoxin reductase catalytic beta chain [Lachnospiraceae bacterium]
MKKVRFNEDSEMVKKIQEGLKKKQGYCPCRLEQTEDNKCICKEFREQIADPDFEGYCHCRLYYKER